MANTNANDIDLLLMDSDDDQLMEEFIRDKVTKESFLAMIESATTGGDFLNIINLLPNSSQRYGHSLTMNAITNIVSGTRPIGLYKSYLGISITCNLGYQSPNPFTVPITGHLLSIQVLCIRFYSLDHKAINSQCEANPWRSLLFAAQLSTI
jgi:hypothetical protein